MSVNNNMKMKFRFGNFSEEFMEIHDSNYLLIKTEIIIRISKPGRGILRHSRRYSKELR